MLTGDSCCCQYKICYFIIAKSNKYLEDACFSFHMSKLLMFGLLKILKEFPPYFILYHALDEHTYYDFVTCSGQVSHRKEKKGCI